MAAQRTPARMSDTLKQTLRLGLLAVAFCLSTAVCAAPKSAPVEARRGELNELHGRLEKLHQDLSKTEETKTYATDQLKETESSISNVNRDLRELALQRGETHGALTELQQQSQRIERQIASQQEQLGQLLYRQYLNGDTDALQLLLSGEDANQASRDLHYMTLLSRAKADLLGVLRSSLNEKQRLADATRAKNNELAIIEQKQQQQRSTLLTQQQQRQAMLTRLADKIKTQRHEIDTLKRDEKRLSKLIEGLIRIVSKKGRKPVAAARARSERLPPEETPLRNEQEPEAIAYSGNFAGLKGHLHLPTRGELANRFGTARAEGGATWKGLFIRAAEGAEVKAVGPGRVVFADWLRGFGNLLIIDHGDAFLSVYGNNQSLFRQVGDTVKGGDAVAAVGNSGGNPESGLYFELRRQGQAIDPLKWVSLR